MLLLGLSILVNILLVLTIWRLQDKVKLSLETIKHMDLVKDSIKQVVASKLDLDQLEKEKGEGEGISEEEESFEIISKGKSFSVE